MATKILRSVNLSNKQLISWRNARFPNFTRLTTPISFGCTVQPDRHLSARNGNFVANYAQAARFLHGGAPPANEAMSQLSDVEYSKIADETLESLTEMLEELADSRATGGEFDVSFFQWCYYTEAEFISWHLRHQQAVSNKQLWLSSPRSGPKRYDFMNGTWMYKYEGKISS